MNVTMAKAPPWTRSRSRRVMAWSSMLPRPGRTKTDSMTTVPARSAANWSPKMVSTGMAALRKPCRHRAAARVSPLERAVRM